VFLLHRGDSTAIYASIDTVFIKRTVEGKIPESVAAKDLPLKFNADYIKVRNILNYPLLLIISGASLVILIIVWLIFGQRIRKYYRLKRLEKKHQAFLQRFMGYVQSLKNESSPAQAETAVVDWKKYMEGLLGRPFTKLTTKEILGTMTDHTLGDALHQVDRMIYARENIFPEAAFEELRSYSQKEFVRVKQEVRNG
jgi:hypothetical protein